MKQHNIYNFYGFGFNYCVIKQNGLKEWPKEDAIKHLKLFLDKIDELELRVTQQACKKVKGFRKRIEDLEVDNVPVELANELIQEVTKLDVVIDSELKLKKAYILTEKRYSLEKLMTKQDQLLSIGAYNNMSDNAQKDFSSGCYQIALNQATGAAFHLMRALEEQIKQMYFHFKKTKRLARPMWGPMLNQLESKNKPKPSQKLIDYLNSIRIHYRNPTQHPELFYTMDEAQNLLNQTISALSMINAEIKN